MLPARQTPLADAYSGSGVWRSLGAGSESVHHRSFAGITLRAAIWQGRSAADQKRRWPLFRLLKRLYNTFFGFIEAVATLEAFLLKGAGGVFSMRFPAPACFIAARPGRERRRPHCVAAGTSRVRCNWSESEGTNDAPMLAVVPGWIQRCAAS
jgi:hypothetical protein